MRESLLDDCSAEVLAKSLQLVPWVEDHPLLVGDPELLRRGIENVLRNVIRYAPAGSPIDVTLRASGATATVSIRDRDPGVPDAALTSSFQPCFRVSNDQSRVVGGVGLGLSIARRAIDLHRGRIWFQNAGPELQVAIKLPITA